MNPNDMQGKTIRHRSNVMLTCNRIVETWLRKDAAAAYDALKADPSRAMSASTIKAHLAAARQQASAKA